LTPSQPPKTARTTPGRTNTTLAIAAGYPLPPPLPFQPLIIGHAGRRHDCHSLAHLFCEITRLFFRPPSPHFPLVVARLPEICRGVGIFSDVFFGKLSELPQKVAENCKRDSFPPISCEAALRSKRLGDLPAVAVDNAKNTLTDLLALEATAKRAISGKPVSELDLNHAMDMVAREGGVTGRNGTFD